MTSLQRNQANVVTNSPEDYYRISIFNTYVDYLFINWKKELSIMEKFSVLLCVFFKQMNRKESFIKV